MKKIMSFCLILCMMLVSGCNGLGNGGEDKDKVVDLGKGEVLAVGESIMTADEFKFFLDDIKSQMEGTELADADSWETAEIEGKKAIDIAKERAYESAVIYLTQIEIAKNLGLEYSKEDMESIKSQINTAYFEQYENAEDLIQLICEATLYNAKLQEKMLAEQENTDEEIEKYFNENKELIEAVYMRAKHVLILTQNMETGEPLSDAEKATAKEKAESILARAQSGENFDALVGEFSEDPGSASYPEGYVFTSGEMVSEFENCVRSLPIDGIGIAESSFGHHVIQRLALDAAVCKDVISNELYMEKFEKYIDDLTKEFKLEPIRNDEEYNLIK